MKLVRNRWTNSSAHAWEGHEGKIIEDEGRMTFVLNTKAGMAYGIGQNPNGYSCSGEALVLQEENTYITGPALWYRLNGDLVEEAIVSFDQGSVQIDLADWKICEDQKVVEGVKALLQ